MRQISVKVQPDYIASLCRVRKPILAVAELIWNGLDADAAKVEVRLRTNRLSGLEEVAVRDNGHGIRDDEAVAAFENLGGSPKRTGGRSRRERRVLHGKFGRGRFRAFALGDVVTWRSVYDSGGKRYGFEIRGSTQHRGTFTITDPEPSQARTTGTEVVISSIERDFRSLTGDDAPQNIAELFALYLRQYPKVAIWYSGSKVEPQLFERHTADYHIGPVKSQEGQDLHAGLTVIEWSIPAERTLHLCDANGFALYEMPPGIQAPGFNFTAYLKSDRFRELDGQDALPLEELNPDVHHLVDAAKEQLRGHFRHRAAQDASSLVAQWKKDEVYPYKGEPANVVEYAERQVFDVLALNVNEYLPDFDKSDVKSKKLSLRLLRQALENSPDQIRLIFNEVLDLPEEKQKDLAALLERTSLAAIINAARVVADRLEFLKGLEVLVFDEQSKEQLRERTQLHRILAEHTWVFGEQFALSVDDQSLTEVLQQHLKLLGREPDAGGEVVREDGSRGIVDLMLSRRIPLPDAEEREHLVIELKRPSQRVNAEATTQIESYAIAVAQDERFRDTKTRWTMWAVSNDMDDGVRLRSNQPKRPAGLLMELEDPRIKVWVQTWGQLIQSCRGRLEFFQKSLDYTADRGSALKHLRELHAKYLPPALGSGPV